MRLKFGLGMRFHQSLLGLLGTLGVAFHAQNSAIQWVAAISVCLDGKGTSTILQTTSNVFF